MKKYVLVTLSLLFVAGMFFLNGCETPEGGSSLPWGAPAEWEGQSPYTVQND